MFVDWQLFRRRALGLSIISIIIVFIVWNIPQLQLVMYPFRLFVTFIHEAGHGLAAILSGGEFVRFEVMANGAGLATTRGGTRAIILPAGYLGAALFGTGLFYITNRVPYPRLIALGVSAALIALALLFGQTSQVALMVGLAFGMILAVMSLLISRYMVVFVLNFLATMTALNAVLDLLFLTRNTMAQTADGRALNDAAAFTQEIVPTTTAELWAWVWAGASLFILSVAIYLSVLHPLIIDAMIAHHRRRGGSDSYASRQMFIEDSLAEEISPSDDYEFSRGDQ